MISWNVFDSRWRWQGKLNHLTFSESNFRSPPHLRYHLLVNMIYFLIHNLQLLIYALSKVQYFIHLFSLLNRLLSRRSHISNLWKDILMRSWVPFWTYFYRIFNFYLKFFLKIEPSFHQWFLFKCKCSTFWS